MSCEGHLLVIRRMLGQIQKPFDETQRENIFHTYCLIDGNRPASHNHIIRRMTT